MYIQLYVSIDYVVRILYCFDIWLIDRVGWEEKISHGFVHPKKNMFH